ncbi:hypothetical protein [Actibacterium sp.]|uniref:hypothetical protein n=1 Tax=Actibacterium sp. TaxID=1872125 RepID=UPI0035672C3A
MTEITEDLACDAAEYVLGLGDAASRRAFEDKMKEIPALRDEVLGWDSDFAELLSLYPTRVPPRKSLRRVEKLLFKGLPATPRHKTALSGARILAGALIAVLLLAVLIGRFVPPPPVAPPGSQPAQANVK